MSAAMKGKYEVLKIVRDNVLKGMISFGFAEQQEGEAPKCTWRCMEYDQASFRNYDKVVLLRLAKVTRVGFQCTSYVPAVGSAYYGRKESWIEEQEWEIQAVLKRRTGEVTADTVTTEDVAHMLISWFNGPGVDEFRAKGCGNLFVKDTAIRTYKGGSDVPQFRSIFTLKLQVPKSFVVQVPGARVKYKGMLGV